MPDETLSEEKQLATSGDMNKFYRVLSIVNSNAILRVMEPTSAKAKIDRAIRETELLVNAANTTGSGLKCGPGTVWDEFTKRCVPIE
jgi:hypothetical protein